MVVVVVVKTQMKKILHKSEMLKAGMIISVLKKLYIKENIT